MSNDDGLHKAVGQVRTKGYDGQFREVYVPSAPFRSPMAIPEKQLGERSNLICVDPPLLAANLRVITRQSLGCIYEDPR